MTNFWWFEYENRVKNQSTLVVVNRTLNFVGFIIIIIIIFLIFFKFFTRALSFMMDEFA